MKLCDGRRDNTGGAGDSSWNLRMRSGLHAPPWERPGGKRARVTDGAQNGAPSPCGGWAGFESGSSAAIGAFPHCTAHTVPTLDSATHRPAQPVPECGQSGMPFLFRRPCRLRVWPSRAFAFGLDLHLEVTDCRRTTLERSNRTTERQEPPRSGTPSRDLSPPIA